MSVWQKSGFCDMLHDCTFQKKKCQYSAMSETSEGHFLLLSRGSWVHITWIFKVLAFWKPKIFHFCFYFLLFYVSILITPVLLWHCKQQLHNTIFCADCYPWLNVFCLISSRAFGPTCFSWLCIFKVWLSKGSGQSSKNSIFFPPLHSWKEIIMIRS